MLDRIKASLPSLAPAEQRVGKLVLQDPRAFANLPVTELADRAHVSKPTVVRFCRSVGYDGLSDFKLKLAGSVSEGVPFIHRSVDVDDKTTDVMVKVIDNTVAAFLKYRNDASSFALEHAAQALAATLPAVATRSTFAARSTVSAMALAYVASTSPSAGLALATASVGSFPHPASIRLAAAVGMASSAPIRSACRSSPASASSCLPSRCRGATCWG